MDFRRLCHIARCVLVVVTAVIHGCYFSGSFLNQCVIVFMEVYPVLPITAKVPRIPIRDLSRNAYKLVESIFRYLHNFSRRLRTSFSTRCSVSFRRLWYDLQSDLFFLVLQKLCHKFFSDLFQRRTAPFIIIRNFQQFFPGNICFLKFLRQNSEFSAKTRPFVRYT